SVVSYQVRILGGAAPDVHEGVAWEPTYPAAGGIEDSGVL
ncbi:MAG: hypothetical protein JWQ59_1542, partial [Cryobacterium sp.]|nr:hypothetical protein [Cryobacterium sp.]